MSSSPHENILASDEAQAISVLRQPSSQDLPSTQSSKLGYFPFLSLPLEIRLQIYALVLPPRSHTIVTQRPLNGHNYTTSSAPSTQTMYVASFDSLYPSSHITTSGPLTTYKILNANFRFNFPNQSICPQLLRVSKQLLSETEPVLYAAPDVIWDFGIYVDAVIPFFEDRSKVARSCVRNIKVARELPGLSSALTSDGYRADPSWDRTCSFFAQQFDGLRSVELTVWREDGKDIEFPLVVMVTSEQKETQMVDSKGSTMAGEIKRPASIRWQDWGWTKRLLMIEGLTYVKVTCPKAQSGIMSNFDGCFGKTMAAKNIVRDKMIYGGCVIEGVVAVPAMWSALDLLMNSGF